MHRKSEEKVNRERMKKRQDELLFLSVFFSQNEFMIPGLLFFTLGYFMRRQEFSLSLPLSLPIQLQFLSFFSKWQGWFGIFVSDKNLSLHFSTTLFSLAIITYSSLIFSQSSFWMFLFRFFFSLLPFFPCFFHFLPCDARSMSCSMTYHLMLSSFIPFAKFNFPIPSIMVIFLPTEHQVIHSFTPVILLLSYPPSRLSLLLIILYLI